MGNRWKAQSSREFTRVLLNNGFKYVGCRGDHKKFRRGTKTVVVNKDLNKMIMQRLIKENNLEV